MAIRAGELNQRITFERLAGEVRDAAGEPQPAWQELFAVSAKFTPVTASQRYSSDRFIASESGTFLVRARRDWGKDAAGNDLDQPSAKHHRISYRGRKWDITGVQPMGRNDGEGYLLTAEVPEVGGADQE